MANFAICTSIWVSFCVWIAWERKVEESQIGWLDERPSSSVFNVLVVKPFEVSIHVSKLTCVCLKIGEMTLKVHANKEDLSEAAASRKSDFCRDFKTQFSLFRTVTLNFDG